MAKAKKLPSGNWRVLLYDGKDPTGKRIYESFTAPTKKEAERMAAVWESEREMRRQQLENTPVKELIASYIKTCEAAGMSPETIRSYIAMSHSAFSLIGDVLISRLTLSMIQDQIDERARSRAPKTVRNELGLLRSSISRYRKDIEFDDLILPKRRKTEMVIPTDEQVKQLIADVSKDDDMYIAVLLAALMGLRRSEICALEWTDIDKETRTLHVGKALVRDPYGKHRVKPPKTAAGDRYLPIPENMYIQITARRKTLDKRLVRLSPNAITERYERVRVRLKIPGRFHDLRHYHASVMLAVGAPEKYIVADMGHSSFDMVRKVYGHIMEEKKRELAQGLAAHSTKILDDAT